MAPDSLTAPYLDKNCWNQNQLVWGVASKISLLYDTLYFWHMKTKEGPTKVEGCWTKYYFDKMGTLWSFIDLACTFHM